MKVCSEKIGARELGIDLARRYADLARERLTSFGADFPEIDPTQCNFFITIEDGEEQPAIMVEVLRPDDWKSEGDPDTIRYTYPIPKENEPLKIRTWVSDEDFKPSFTASKKPLTPTQLVTLTRIASQLRLQSFTPNI